MTVPVSGEDQPDPRQRALRLLLDAIYAGADYRPETILGALDEVDRAAGIRRVTEASLKCPACECYYDANGVSCYRESHVDWVCVEMGDRS